MVRDNWHAVSNWRAMHARNAGVGVLLVPGMPCVCRIRLCRCDVKAKCGMFLVVHGGHAGQCADADTYVRVWVAVVHWWGAGTLTPRAAWKR